MTVSARRVAFVITAVSLMLLVLGMGFVGSRAWAYLNPGGAPASAPAGRLQLAVSDETPMRATLAPGESTQWLISAGLTGAPQGTLALEVAADGDLVTPQGLDIEARICDERFSVTGSPLSVSCPSVTTALIPRQSLLTATSPVGRDLFELPPLHLGSIQQVLVIFTLPYDSAPNAEDSATIGLGFHAAGDYPRAPQGTPDPQAPGVPDRLQIVEPEPNIPPEQRAPPPGPNNSEPELVPPAGPADLAFTGLDLVALLTLGFGLIGLGSAALLRRPHRNQRRG